MKPRASTAGILCALLVTSGAAAQTPHASEKEGKAPPGASPEAARSALADAARAVREAEKGGRPRLLDFESYVMRASEEDRVRALTALARAQVKAGDPGGARETIEAASDLADSMRDAEKVDALHQVARAMIDAGDKEGALAAIKQALRGVRSLKVDPDMPRMPGSDQDIEATRAGWYRELAALQARAGDEAGARAAFELAIASAKKIGEDEARVKELVAIARARGDSGDSAGAESAWSSAAEVAGALRDNARTRAVEAVARARVQAGAAGKALELVAGSLEGDAQAHAVWIVADALMANGVKLDPAVVERLRELARSARYDRPSKRIKAVTRTAQVLVKSGDVAGALEDVEQLADPTVSHYHTDKAKITVLLDIARARASAKDINEARKRLDEILEVAAPFRDEDGLAGLDWAEVALQQARSGLAVVAIETAGSIGQASMRVVALARLASALAEAGDGKSAGEAIARAKAAAEAIPSEMLWSDYAARPRPAGLEFDMRPRALREIARAQAKARDYDGAMGTIDAIGRPGTLPGDFERLTACNAVALARARAGDFAGALKTMDALKGCQPMVRSNAAKTLAGIAEVQARRGDAAGAVAWAREQPSAKAKVLALAGVARGINEAGDGPEDEDD